MAKVAAYHTSSSEYPPSHREVYHDHDDCADGRKIKREHKESGQGGTAVETPRFPTIVSMQGEEKGEDEVADAAESIAPDGIEPGPQAPVVDVEKAMPGPHAPVARDVLELFAAVRVERTAGGGVRLEAPPEAAASLVALFAGMARLLGQAAG